MKRRMLVAVTCLLWSMAASAAEPAVPATGVEPKPEPPAAPELSTSAEPRVDTSSSAQQPAANEKRGPVSPDRLQLDTTIVTGNRELPKVLYIVPWKKADIGELPQPFNSLLDEALAPVDRDVFRREVTYFGIISGTTAAPPDGAAAEQQTIPAKK